MTASSLATMANMRRRYEQYCPVAHALDLVGERWALLVVRELMHGPKRYTDLAEHLPGIGTNDSKRKRIRAPSVNHSLRLSSVALEKLAREMLEASCSAADAIRSP